MSGHRAAANAQRIVPVSLLFRSAFALFRSTFALFRSTLALFGSTLALFGSGKPVSVYQNAIILL